MNAVTMFEGDARTAGVEYFDPENHLLGALSHGVAEGQDLHIEVTGLGELVVLSSRGEYFAYTSDLPALLKAAPQNARITPMTPEKGRTPTILQVGRNIDELMWQAAFFASEGRLMKGCYRDDVVMLEFWPNFSRLPHTPNSMRITALLSRHPTSIFLAGRLLKVDAKEMYQFYSAARAAGFARAINRKPEEPKIEPHRNQSLLSSLLKKIARL